MSRVEQVAESKSIAELPVQSEEEQPDTEHQRRIFVHFSGTASQLRHGAIQQLANNPVDLFKPQFSADATEAERNADYSKPIISSIRMNSVMSNCPAPVTMGMNLHNIKNPEVVNAEGLLYTKQDHEISAEHAFEQEGYVNLASILPFEKARCSVDLYSPTNLLDSRHVKEYGGYTLDKLWEGIVPFQNEDFYYVDEDHVVTKIINQNWDKLGVNLAQEATKEGRYLKLSKPMVKSIIDQLYSTVIQKIPYTDVSNLGLRLQSNVDGSDKYDVCAELLVSYRFPRS